MSNTTPVQGHYDTSSVFVAVIGRPNVGKSSLTNLLVGEKVAIVTSKPQTTRTRITGVITRGPLQYVLLDTPGVHKALSLIHISEPTRRTPISYAVFCLKKKKKNN